MHSAIHNSVIRDNIEGNRLIELSTATRRIIDTIEFQRLRNIKQMGVSSYVFPGAEHSRFAHSLGVYANATQAFRQLRRRSESLDFQTPGFKFDEHTEVEFGIAALCHDIGHSAFSHVLETILLPDGIRNHEDCTYALLSTDTEIANEIDKVADLESVQNLLSKKHPNKALGDLISSAFDVDRCDYVLRDSHMAGVEYGKYDLKWLFHAMTVDSNELGQPVLLLDGPRGIDALRQFLSARRYLHRQVYFHPTVRGAQLLLKAIFARIQDTAGHADSIKLAPSCLHELARGGRLSRDNFVQTTDIEIEYMIKLFSREHGDPVLRFLTSQFVHRKFPKCVIDSARSSSPLSEKYHVSAPTESAAEEKDRALMDEYLPADLIKITEDVREFVASRFEANSLPREVAGYLVAFDPAPFLSTPPTDLLFAFDRETVALESIDPECVGFDINGLLERFSINRVYVPREFVDECREYVEKKYRS